MSTLSGLVFQTNRAIDKGHSQSLQRINDAITDERLVQHLQDEYPDEFKFSADWYDDEQIDEVNMALEDYNRTTLADEYGVENNGLCHVVALLTEIIQQGERWEWGPSHDDPPR